MGTSQCASSWQSFTILHLFQVIFYPEANFVHLTIMVTCHPDCCVVIAGMHFTCNRDTSVNDVDVCIEYV